MDTARAATLKSNDENSKTNFLALKRARELVDKTFGDPKSTDEKKIDALVGLRNAVSKVQNGGTQAKNGYFTYLDNEIKALENKAGVNNNAKIDQDLLIARHKQRMQLPPPVQLPPNPTAAVSPTDMNKVHPSHRVDAEKPSLPTGFKKDNLTALMDKFQKDIATKADGDPAKATKAAAPDPKKGPPGNKG